MYTVVKFINRISKEHGYKKLPDDKSVLARKFYEKYLPELFGDEPIFSPKGELIAHSYNRIVIGDYGAYIEISKDALICDLKVKQGQEYRLKDDFNGKYLWCTTKYNDCKIYFQLKSVSYADYKPGKFYISVYNVRQEIHN